MEISEKQGRANEAELEMQKFQSMTCLCLQTSQVLIIDTWSVEYIALVKPLYGYICIGIF